MGRACLVMCIIPAVRTVQYNTICGVAFLDDYVCVQVRTELVDIQLSRPMDNPHFKKHNYMDLPRNDDFITTAINLLVTDSNTSAEREV